MRHAAVLWIWLGLTAPAWAVSGLVSSVDACGKEEVLEWGEDTPKLLLKLFSLEDAEGKAAIKRWSAAATVKRTIAKPEVQLVAELATARALYLMGWDHPAAIAFSDLWRKAAGAKNAAIRTATAQCLRKLHRGLPSLDFTPELLRLLKSPVPELAVKDADAIEELYIGALLGGISRGEKISFTDVQRATKGWGLKSSGTGLAQALVAAANGKVDGAVGLFKRLLDRPSASPALSRVQDFARLMIARTAMQDGNFDAAMAQYERITPRSEWYEKAAVEYAWATLNAKQYGKTVGAAYNLRHHRGFLPDPLVAASMAFLETCHYGDSREALKMFKALYVDASFWLRDWKNKGGKSDDLYRQAVEFVKNPKSVPSPVGYAWIGSKVFQSSQAELNRIIDEQEGIEAAKSSVKSDLARDFFPTFLENLRDRESEVIARVNASLADQNNRMLARLRDLIQDSQLIWVESLSKVGEDIAQPIRRDIAGEEPAVEENGNAWKWGKRQALGRGNDEIWKDEEGSFLAELKNLCAK